MIYKKLLSAVLLTLLIVPMNFAYMRSDDKTEEEKVAELKTNARELLRETSAMALTLASPTNRVNFTIKSADILWGLDETDARAMFNASIEDVKRLMGQVDIETNQQQEARKSTWSGRSSSSRSRLRSKTSQVFSLRSSLVSALSNHDPEWAMRFLQETNSVFTNRSLISRNERDIKRLESRVIRKIAAKDVTKALELGREKLSKGVSSDVISLVNQIYQKDKDKGADFADDVLQKLKTQTLKNRHTWMVVSLFQAGLTSNKSDSDKTPLFDKSGMNSLAELVAKQVTNSSSRYRSLSSSVMKGLETYSPNSASQVKRTFEQRASARNNRSSRGGARGSGDRSLEKQRYEERAKFQNEVNSDLNTISSESVSDEDRSRAIEDAKNKILSVNDDSFRFNSLIRLAITVANVGEKESASNILNEAESFINQDPKERREFTSNRTLANAYALVDANRSFAILENMVYRLNTVINGYVQYMQFSGNGRVVENDELIMNSRSRQFVGYLRFDPQALRSLAESDFTRLKDITERFERNEIRVEARLMMAKTLLTAAQPKVDLKNSVRSKITAQTSNFDKRMQTFENDLNVTVK